ncbi:MFS transporter [Hufsiella ginkgonis]|uniref:MFS transporter n=1 Tax=Hufsiella ginkgonis TaxID=2695274 RepID=A0A7K1Y3G4_9SPHI|nr:MFS transporter [Hufsiella ginkgonis]MXV17833.1 MFS transporter [Hufsiella ginkgonis]
MTTKIPATSAISKNTIRFALFGFFFCQGICFASWASRIPDLKLLLKLSEGELGSVLLALPAGQLCTLPFSGKLVARLGSRQVMLFAVPLYSLALINIGFSSTALYLTASLFLFGVAGNMANISINTQGVAVEKLFGRPLMASFHGGWSLAGFTGAALGTLMISLKLPPHQHYYFISALVFVIVLTASRYLLKGKPAPAAKRPLFSKPDGSLLQLGVIGFCCMAAEGAMFDWSGVYFQKVVMAPTALITLGYAAFMSTMAGGRFAGDRLVHRFGQRKMIQASGVLIASGLGISILFPYIVPVTIGFLITGFGVSSVIPTVYSAAGRSKLVPPSIALASVSGVSFFGFLLGPPVIGYIAELSNLRYSYGFIAMLGFCTTILASRAALIQSKAS